MRRFLRAVLLIVSVSASMLAQQQPKFRVLAFYSEKVEHDHVDFAHDAIKFYTAAGERDHFTFDSTTNWEDMNAAKVADYDLVVWLNDFPHSPAQRAAFEQYMEHGGGWLGFHVAGYNDRGTKWPWYLSFLGGGVFYGNNWPPLPAELIVDDPSHPAMQHVPKTFLSPANEWYNWKPSPRENKDVKVLLTLAPSNYPIGMKDVIKGGDLPVTWTNTRYRMVYTNIGHGDRIFTSDMQNRMLEDMILWVGPKRSTETK